MVVGGSQQETLDQGFVIFGTSQQGVPVILRELVPPVSPSFTGSDGENKLDSSGERNREVEKRPVVLQGKPSLGIVQVKGEEKDQRTHNVEKWRQISEE
ncbi:unnamed protein product [Schistosoma margrebowiei]|uniref:Uncharacterized protein n=1 Tax=Schistosoma margrebowiei TaxID=48269 RepID=A0A183LKD3_9TREM|nr:unnamed protein product [Schistosoma margrebowiei]